MSLKSNLNPATRGPQATPAEPTEPPAETPREQINARMRRIRDLDRDLKAWTDAAERLDGWQCGSDEYGDPSEDTEAAAAYHGVCAMIARARKLRRTLLNEVAAIEQQHGLATTPEDILVGFERKDSMHTYRVWYSNGSAVLINAHTATDARQMALEQAEADGRPGLSVAQVEQLN